MNNLLDPVKDMWINALRIGKKQCHFAFDDIELRLLTETNYKIPARDESD